MIAENLFVSFDRRAGANLLGFVCHMKPTPPQGRFLHHPSAPSADTDALMTAIEKQQAGVDYVSFPRKFREMCTALALARYRMDRQALIDELNERVIRGYKLLYKRRSSGWEAVVRGTMFTFPHAVRREWRLFWLSSALFWIPFFALYFSALVDTQWVESVLGSSGIQGIEQMYGGSRSDQISHLRDAHGSNFMMFCFYIYNNVGIDFQLFAGGVLAGLGTVFYLFYNGLMIGASAGYVQVECNPESFWTFVVGHSSFELLGMIVVGMAGLKMGMGIWKPGLVTRAKALKDATMSALPLLFGGSLMTALAAVVEGFWSANEAASGWKYGVGGFFWLLHACYFLWMGKGKEVVA